MKSSPSRALEVLDILNTTYPDARIALVFTNPFELLVATVLSAQCTDVRVNMVTPALFRRYPEPRAFAEADISELGR
jgi:endonuclease-3